MDIRLYPSMMLEDCHGFLSLPCLTFASYDGIYNGNIFVSTMPRYRIVGLLVSMLRLQSCVSALFHCLAHVVTV